MDTIFALASARGKAGVAVIRISGPEAHVVAKALCGPLPHVRQAALRQVRWQGEVLDQALLLVFGKGASFTGEDVAELHVHGSVATISAIMDALSQQAGSRLAEAGEFTRRALENGCLDLTQVEGLADLIEAETEAQRRQAQRVFSGAIGAKFEVWRPGLVRTAALVEATIDFADEEVPVDVSHEVLRLIDLLMEDFSVEAAATGVAERIRDGFEVAIVGLPNAGKSTLLNRLAGREAAITSSVAGTTRDVIEVRMDLAGLPVLLLDTAGLRQASDEVEAIGVARALVRAGRADLRVFLLDRGAWPEGLSPQEGDIVVEGKSDLLGPEASGLSGLTGEGVDRLVAEIGAILGHRASGAGILNRARHQQALSKALGALELARIEVLSGPGRTELAAEHLRAALRAMDALVGRIGVEDLLGEIFASFCIGK